MAAQVFWDRSCCMGGNDINKEIKLIHGVPQHQRLSLSTQRALLAPYKIRHSSGLLLHLTVKSSSCLLPEFCYTLLLLLLSMLESILHCDSSYTQPCIKPTQTQGIPSLISCQLIPCAHLSCWCFQEWLMSSTTYPFLFFPSECNSWQWSAWKAKKRVFPGRRAASGEKRLPKP